jgi:hypothetical protein
VVNISVSFERLIAFDKRGLIVCDRYLNLKKLSRRVPARQPGSFFPAMEKRTKKIFEGQGN